MSEESRTEAENQLLLLDYKRKIGDLKIQRIDLRQEIKRLNGVIADRDAKIQSLKINHIDDEELKELIDNLARHQKEGQQLRKRVKSMANEIESLTIDLPPMGAPRD